MDDIIFNTERPRNNVPIVPTKSPALWNASGMARNPPPIVAFTICIKASKFLYGIMRENVSDNENKNTTNMKILKFIMY